MSEHSLLLRIPATTANLGPGFDCLGMALNIWSELEVEQSPNLEFILEGEGFDSLPKNKSNVVYKALETVFSEQNMQVPGLKLRYNNAIPLSRGLGSSAAAIVAGLYAANILLGKPENKSQLLQKAAGIEGHADNVAPALFGGCQVVFREEKKLFHCRIPLGLKLNIILFIPDFPMPTDRGRAILKPLVERGDAVYNLSRVALLATGLSTGKLEYLKFGTQDRLHQPSRQELFPAMGIIFRAALSAGASAVFLSGSGSTILAMCQDNGEIIGKAMLRAGKQQGLKAKVVFTTPTSKGVHLVNHKNAETPTGSLPVNRTQN